MALNRRTLLRGAGVCLPLPLLDAMIPNASANIIDSPISQKRAAFVYVPHGVILDEFNYGSILRPLEPFRDSVNIYDGMKLNTNNIAGSGHATSSATWLSGAICKDTSGADIEAGKTIDQMIADKIRGDTPLPSMQIGIEDVSMMVGACDGTSSCAYINSISWDSDTSNLPMEINPRILFEKMFGYGATQNERLIRTSLDASLLDSIMDSSATLRKRLGGGDKERLSDFLESVREVEVRITNLENRLRSQGANLSVAPVEIPELYEDHVRTMFDIMTLALRTDTTRVISLMLSRELNQRTYPQIGVPEQHHGVSHHGYNEERQALHALINTYHVKLFAEHFVSRLADTQELDGSLLDNTLILYGAGMGDGNVHSKDPVSNFIVGGQNLGMSRDTRRDLTDENGNSTPNTNLLLGILNRFDIHLDSLGHSTGLLI